MTNLSQRFAFTLMALTVTSIAAIFIFLAVAIVPYWESLDAQSLQDWFAGPFQRFSIMMVPLHFASIISSMAATIILRGTKLFRPVTLAFLFLIACQALNFTLYGADINPALSSGVLSSADANNELGRWHFWHFFRTAAIVASSATMLVSVTLIDQKMKTWVIWFVFGILAIVGGFLAFANPFAAAVTVEQMTAWFFVLSGLAWVGSSLLAHGWGAKLLSIMVGTTIVWIGLVMLTNPVAGIFSIALTIGASVLVLGLIKMSVAISGRKEQYFWPVLFSSLVSILIGALILFGVSPIATLSTLLAVQLITVGMSMIGMSLWARKLSIP